MLAKRLRKLKHEQSSHDCTYRRKRIRSSPPNTDFEHPRQRITSEYVKSARGRLLQEFTATKKPNSKREPRSERERNPNQGRGRPGSVSM